MARTARTEGSASATARGGGTVRRRPAISLYAARTVSSTLCLFRTTGPSNASGAITMSSHASATRTAWP